MLIQLFLLSVLVCVLKEVVFDLLVSRGRQFGRVLEICSFLLLLLLAIYFLLNFLLLFVEKLIQVLFEIELLTRMTRLHNRARALVAHELRVLG